MAARRRVIWAPRAQAALDEAVAFVAEDSPVGALRILEQALAAANSLSSLSERGRVVPERDDPGLREIFVFRYRLDSVVLDLEVIDVPGEPLSRRVGIDSIGREVRRACPREVVARVLLDPLGHAPLRLLAQDQPRRLVDGSHRPLRISHEVCEAHVDPGARRPFRAKAQ